MRLFHVLNRILQVRRLFFTTAVVVVFITTYSLILPAITMEKKTVCGIEEHEHTDDCYTTTTVCVCGLDETEGHAHSDACYKEEKVLVCEQKEEDGHVHTDECYETERILICGKQETEGHTHDESCFETETELTCGKEEHIHSSECFAEPETEKEVQSETEAAETEGKEETAAGTLPAAEEGLLPGDSTEKETPGTVENETVEKKAAAGETAAGETAAGETAEESIPVQDTADSTEDSQTAAERALRAEGNGYQITVICGSEAGIPEDAELEVREIRQGSADYKEYISDTEKQLEPEEGTVSYARFFDITITDASGREIQPEEAVDVRIVLDDLQDRIGADAEEAAQVVHFSGDPERIDAEMAGDEVNFEAEGFSVYGIIATTIEKTVLASDGQNYKISVSCGPETGIPENAELYVEEITESSSAYDAYAAAAVNALGAEKGSAGYIRLFDIKIVDKDDPDVKYQPKDGTAVDVKIELSDQAAREEVPANTQVVHFADGTVSGEVIENTVQAEKDGFSASFSAASFSVYAVVDAEEPVNFEDTASSLYDLTSARGEGGFWLSVTQGSATDNYYMQSVLNGNGAFAETTDRSQAAVWFFEPVEGTTDRFRIYTGSSSSRQYLARDPSDAQNRKMKLSDTGDVFQVTQSSGKFYIRLDGQDNWIQHSGSGSGIRLYSQNSNAGNCKFTFTFSEIAPANPYGLDGMTYGIMNRKSDTAAYGMLAEEKGNGLDVKQALIRTDPMDPNHLLYVAKDSDIAMWTFEKVEKDIYYLQSEGKYLRITGNKLALADTPDEHCRIRVIPGTGANAGKVRLLGEQANKAVYLPGDNKVFNANAESSSGNSWHNLMEKSVLEDSDFVEYAAYKVSVSDRVNVANDKQVLIYTRVWNPNDKKYEFYAVDQNSNLVPCYESGDSIVWIGTQNNQQMLWNFTEYYNPGTTTPNGYYTLQNAYTGQYIAPQINGGQILSDEFFRVNLNGRRYGDYYTPILAWDDPHYDYAGYKVENGKIVSCPMAEADTFYFAVMKKAEGTLTPVETVDHEALGLTMKMIDCSDQAYMSGILGNNNGGTGTALQQGILSSAISGDAAGYPDITERPGTSLGTLYAGAAQVNHLFIQSIYDGSGYFQFDSSENFAHLSGNNFDVYQELGTVDGGSNTRQHGQFMPYNMLDPNKVHPQHPENLTDIYGNPRSENDPRKYEPLYDFTEKDDHHFAMELTGHFMQPPNGHDAWGHDIIFEFVGDDDFWLYVDGELVIDLGGIHSAVPGSVNYSTGEVNVNGQSTTLKDLFYNNYKNRDNHTDVEAQAYVDSIFQKKMVDGNECYVFRDYTDHTVRIFYMERGAGASNLRMRFNLTTVEPGEVLLKKEIIGTDKQDFTSVRFPFQIYCQTEPGGEYQLLRQEVGTNSKWRVNYQNTSTRVDFAETAEIDNVTYDNVFYLKPGQTASIMTPDNTLSYYIKECGVDTSIYNEVRINDEIAAGVQPEGAVHTKCYETGKAAVSDRKSVTFGNQVDPGQLRTLTIKKRLFAEDGTTELSGQDDPAGFTMRLSLGEDLAYYNQGDYFIKDPSGDYCYFDSSLKTFASIGSQDLADLTPEQLNKVTFRTSPSGAASKLPAGYSIEVRDLLVGTKFKVTEEDYDNPVGYGKRIWTETEGDVSHTYTGYKRVAGSYLVDEGDTENAGVIRDNSNPQIEVHNQRGWGIRANKVWSDQDFMRSHDYAYIAVYVKGELLPDTVRRVDAYNYTTYYFPSLEADAEFSDYRVYEVKLTDPVVAADGTVTYTRLEKMDTGDTIQLGGTDSDGNVLSDLTYEVSYGQGTPDQGGKTRADTVTNTRLGGLRVVKTDWTGTGLADAVFELKQGTSLVGRYTSDAEGLVTTFYLDDGTYTLSETKAPVRHHGLFADITITVENGTYSIPESSERDYVFDQESGVLTVKNRPFVLKAVKQDASGHPLSGAEFALYKQITTSNGVRKDYYPISGYEQLVSGDDGVIQGINEYLSPGSYYLCETKAPSGCEELEEDLCFSIGLDGGVTIRTAAYVSWLRTEEKETADGEMDYTITVINGNTHMVSVWKTDMNYNALTGASFSLYRVADYDDSEERPTENAVPVLPGTPVGEDGILPLGSLPDGEYRLVEEQSPAGYMSASSAIKVFVGSSGVTAMQGMQPAEVTQKGDGHWQEGQADAVWQIRVWNNPGVELPSTGGHGTALISLFGFLLTVTAGAGLAMLQRRRAKGLR
ncbi:MAG: LPXTG cell wall anchor domain-containing protein [Lachnospiraceae bacterium]|nr:LPXTG cell wall anchor domain-containing protein [Lachnospiraceae bacterium]